MMFCEQMVRFPWHPVIETREDTTLEVVQSVFFYVACSGTLDLRQRVDDKNAGDLEHGCGDDEGRVSILQSRPLLELPVDALKVLAVLADGS